MGAALNTVYHNYLSTYAPKGLTRYDTHQKSELRSIYNSIVLLNKEAPWYLPTSRETQQYAVNLKENARQLHHTIAQLGGLEEDGFFHKKSAFSSDREVATATYIGSKADISASPSFDLEVLALASPQENMGLFLSDSPVELPPNTYSFDIAINDINYEFQFTINEGDTNREVQNRLARLINNADIRLKAAVVEDHSLTSLRLTSEGCGLPNGRSEIFSISDRHTSRESGTVNYLGLDYVSRRPTNASFLVNGEQRSSVSNHFTVGKQFEVTLTGISPEDTPTHIGLKTDVDSLTDNVIHLVNGYNDFLSAAFSHPDSPSRSKLLLQEFKGIASLYGSSLESLGVNLNTDGTFSVDKDLLHRTASESEDVKETFRNLKPFSNQLLLKSDHISLNPMDYVDKKIVVYKNPGHNFVNPYLTSPYSGMMFNGYC